jgi:drug/metabolite transporter (DMT)-like permease
MSSPVPRQPSHTAGYAAMIFVGFLFGSSLVVARAFADVIPPFGMTAFRWVGVIAILGAIYFREIWRYRSVLRREWLRMLVLGALGMTFPAVTTYFGVHTTTAANIGLISSASPVMVMVGGALLFGQPLSVRRIIGVVLSVVGVAIIVTRGSLDTLLSLTFVPGDLWALAGAVAWASYTLLMIPWRLNMPPMVQLCLLSLTGLASSLPLAVWEALQGQHYHALDWRLPTVAVYTILLPSLLAFALHNFTARTLSPAHAAMSQYLVPVFAAALGAAALGDHFLLFHWIGGGAIIAGVYLASRVERR